MSENNLILSLETATESCSVALSAGEKLIAEKYINQPKAHAALLAKYIREILRENGLEVRDCAAIAVSEGPGSYTGLRVGVSCAKGLCYGAEKPLIAVGTLAVIAQCAIDNGFAGGEHPDSLIVPMIDARRMEVYTAVFDARGRQISPTEAVILNENSFASELEKGPVLFTGNGAEKFKPVVFHPNARFAGQFPRAAGMRIRAWEAFNKKEFEDCAYFEPFYLKDFIAGKPKKLL